MEQHNSISGIFKISKICWIFRLCATTDSLISEPVIFFLSACWLDFWSTFYYAQFESLKVLWRFYGIIQQKYLCEKNINLHTCESKITLEKLRSCGTIIVFFSFMFCAYKISPNIVESWRVRSTLGSIDLWSRIRIFINQQFQMIGSCCIKIRSITESAF